MYMMKHEEVLKSSWSNQAGIPKQILMYRNGYRFLEVSWAFQHARHQYVYKIMGWGYPAFHFTYQRFVNIISFLLHKSNIIQ